MAGFVVVPDRLRIASSSVAAEAVAARRAAVEGADAALSAAGGAGDGPLAAALGELAAELERCGVRFAVAVEGGGDALRRSADTYVATDDEVRVRMAFGQP